MEKGKDNLDMTQAESADMVSNSCTTIVGPGSVSATEDKVVQNRQLLSSGSSQFSKKES